MFLKSVLKNSMGMGASQLINLAAQLIIPPLFIRFYGVSLYGEFLALSATVSYLSSLNFGITTYSTNQLTILRQRGEWQAFDELQASTQLVLASMLGVALMLSATLFVLPLPRLLHLTISREEAALTGAMLALQVIVNLAMGYYNTLYTVVELNHRAIAMANLRRFSSSFACVPFMFINAPFSTLASAGFAATLLSSVWTIRCLRRDAPHLPMGVAATRLSVIRSMLKPSGMFGLIVLQNVLLYQAPVIIFQRILGPAAVVAFTITRTIFGMGRQLITILTLVIQPEITYSYGARHKQKLLSIFLYSERIIFAMIPVVNLGLFVLSPLLLQLWIHKPELFDLRFFGVMALTSAALSMKEHKMNFQFATNQHRLLSLIMFGGTLVLVMLGIPATMAYGLLGFQIVWLVAELVQMFLIYMENVKLFEQDPAVSIRPILKLIANVAAGAAGCTLVLGFTASRPPLQQCFFGGAAMIILMSISYFLYDLHDVVKQVLIRLGWSPGPTGPQR